MTYYFPLKKHKTQNMEEYSFFFFFLNLLMKLGTIFNFWVSTTGSLRYLKLVSMGVFVHIIFHFFYNLKINLENRKLRVEDINKPVYFLNTGTLTYLTGGDLLY